jgi:ferrous iron transport protein B
VLDRARLAEELGVPVVETVAVAGGGADELIAQIERLAPLLDDATPAAATQPWVDPTAAEVAQTHERAQRILAAAGHREPLRSRFVAQADRVIMHPLAGMLVLAALLFVIFQAVFSWAATPMDWIDAGVAALGEAVARALPDGLLRSLLVDGVIAGLGSVVIFLPQIQIVMRKKLKTSWAFLQKTSCAFLQKRAQVFLNFWMPSSSAFLRQWVMQMLHCKR